MAVALPLVVWTICMLLMPSFTVLYLVGIFAVLSTIAEPLVLRRGKGLRLLACFEFVRVTPIILQIHDLKFISIWYLTVSSVVGLYALRVLASYRLNDRGSGDLQHMGTLGMVKIYGAGLLAVVQTQAERIFLPFLDAPSRTQFAAVNTRVPVTTFLAESSAVALIS